MLAAWALTTNRSITLSADMKEQIKREGWAGNVSMRKSLIITRPFAPLNRLILSRFSGAAQKLKEKFSFVGSSLLPEDFLGIKYLLVIGLLIAAYILLKKLEPWLIAIIILIGFVLPDLFLKRLIKKRKTAIIKEFPNAVELLALCVEAGLDLVHGLNWVIMRSVPSPLTKELSLVVQEIKVGRSRHDALKAMAKRVDVPEVFSFINTLNHADRLGSPILDVLKSLAEDSRRRRFQRAERLALKAPIKMLFPLIVFILPVVAIIVAGPIFLKFMSGDLVKF
jgi:tight adherence protein C